MNTSTPTQPQRFAAAFAGAVLAFAPFTVPAASASTHVPGGDSPPTAEQFDVAEFVAHAKAQMAHDRATRPTTYSTTTEESTSTGLDAGERLTQVKAAASRTDGADG